MILGRVCLTNALVRDVDTDEVLLYPMTAVIITIVLSDGIVGVVKRDDDIETDLFYGVPLDSLIFTSAHIPGYLLWPN